MVVFILFLFVALKMTVSGSTEGDYPMVYMKREELMEVIKCVSETRSSALCKRFTECNAMMPQKAIDALIKCGKELSPNANTECREGVPMYGGSDIPLKINFCIAENTSNLSEEEKIGMINFEDCCRKLHADCLASN